MDNVTDFFKGFNIQTIISVFLMLWYFTKHIDEKIEKQIQRTDRLYEMFVDLLKDRK
jgi:hypothetical protein